MEGVKQVCFNIYANDDNEAEYLRNSIISFINTFGNIGVKVTAKKVGYAISNWDSNPIVKNQIIKYLKEK